MKKPDETSGVRRVGSNAGLGFMCLRAMLLFGPTPFGAGCLLAWEEHEQEQSEL